MAKKNLEKPIDTIYDVPKLRAKAVSACLWRIAVERPSVQAFRLEYLGGAALSRKSPPAWISEPLESTKAGMALQSAASDLVLELGLGATEAAALILYDTRPAPPPAIRQLRRGEISRGKSIRAAAGGTATIDLRMSLSASREEVALALRLLQDTLLGRDKGGRDRPQTPKHLHLAMRYAEDGESACTLVAMREWNRQSPAWAYREVKLFNRDLRAAFNGVLCPPKVAKAFWG